ncbi:hypothetical protein NIES4071_34660 [Calothrix sp. NIES-4071]|nr:hypothetical protein NIES4071_34660 [Calothrix sp. NIES-4071]BAZ57785.1 hypothetical protein NIES4105_34590 [Calothrix sp. NIES-4105]
MTLAKKKGYRIETKTLKAKLHRDNIDLSETLSVYRESIAFYIQVINTDSTAVDFAVDKMRSYYEELTLGVNNKYPFIYSDMPRDLRWDVITTACGHYKSWRKNYYNWLKKEEKRVDAAFKKGVPHKPYKPPVLPTEVKDSPTYYKYSMFKDDDGSTVILKIRKNNNWCWVKFSYSAYNYSDDW